jgi:hypothetical protein
MVAAYLDQWRKFTTIQALTIGEWRVHFMTYIDSTVNILYLCTKCNWILFVLLAIYFISIPQYQADVNKPDKYGADQRQKKPGCLEGSVTSISLHKDRAGKNNMDLNFVLSASITLCC